MNEWKADVRIADIVGAILLIALCVFAYYISTTWIPPVLPGDPGAAFFSRIAIGVIFVFSVILLIQRLTAIRRAAAATDSTANDDNTVTIDVAKFLWALLFSGAVVAGIGFFGFEPAAFTFLFILLGWRTGRWLWAFVTSVISVGLMYLLFVPLLTVRLPLLFLPEYLNLNPF